MRRVSTTCLMFALAIATPARAEWIANGTPAGHNFTVVATDGSGGAFIGSIGGSSHPTLQHLTASGDRAQGWPSAGIEPRTRGGHGYSPDEEARVVPDGTGGVYMSMQINDDCTHSCAGDDREIRVQRVLSNGEFANGWPSVGIRVGLVHRSGIPTLVSNGNLGVLVCWWDSNFQLRIQSLDPLGRKRWTEEGVALSWAPGRKSLPVMVGDESGGAFVFWMEGAGSVPLSTTDEARVVGQHVSSAGKPLWAESRSISASYNVATEDHWYIFWNGPDAIADGAGGAIIAWSGKRPGSATDRDIYAARITNGGGLPWQGDVVVCGAANDQSAPRLVSGRGGQILVAWHDRRNPDRESFHAQSLNRGGHERWASGGISFCSAPGTRDGLAATEDGDGGAYFAWHDSRPDGMVYAIRLTPAGEAAPGWTENGTPVSTRFPDETEAEQRPWAIAYNLGLATDGEGSAVLAWSDSRTFCGYDDARCSNRSFAMKLLSDGPATPPTSATASAVHSARAAAKPAQAFASTRPADLALLGSRPIACGGCEVRFSLSTSEPARLDLFDLAGRRLLTRDLGAPGPGLHTASIGSSELSRGVFFVRLSQGEQRTNSRIVLTH